MFILNISYRYVKLNGSFFSFTLLNPKTQF